MNTAILDHVNNTEAQQAQLEKQQKAAAEAQQKRDREAAEKLYWDVLCDASRTSAADKGAFTAAQTLLGKSPDETRDDIALVAEIESVDDVWKKQEQMQAAHVKICAEQKDWLQSGRPAALKAINDKTKELELDKSNTGFQHDRLFHQGIAARNASESHPEITRRLKRK